MSTAAPEAILAPRMGTLLHLAWPIIISRASQVVVGLADAIMVAKLGEAALAATTTGGFNIWNVIILPMGTVFIVGSYASQSKGAGKPLAGRRYAVYGLLVALLAQLLGALSIPWIGSALSLFDYGDEVHALMVGYMGVRMLSVGAAVGLEALGSYYAGMGNTRLPMMANIVAMILNVVANYVLIFGNFGAPAMGVRGAAWASVAATGVGFVLLLGCFVLGVGSGGARALGRLQMAEARRMLRFGLPAGFNWFFEFLAFGFFVNVVMAGFGTTALAALMAVMQLNSAAFMPAFGLASAGSILVGQAIGAKRWQDASTAALLSVKSTVAWQSAVGLSFIAMPALWLAPFYEADGNSSGFFAMGSRFLLLSAGWQLFDAIVTSLAESLRAAGDTQFILWARMAIAWLLFAPGAYISVRVFNGGDVVAMVWVVGYLALLAAVLIWRFRGGAWKNVQLFEPAM